MILTTLKVGERSNLVHINVVIAVTDATGMEEVRVISPRENNWKLLRPCVVIPCKM